MSASAHRAPIAFVVALLGGSCTNPPPPAPGDTNFGSFAFAATVDFDSCNATGCLDAGAMDGGCTLSFTATLSGDRATGAAYLARSSAVGAVVESGFFEPGDGGSAFIACGMAPRYGGSVMVTEAVVGNLYGNIGGCPATVVDASAAAALCNAILAGSTPPGTTALPPLDGGRPILICGEVVDQVPCSDVSDAGEPDACPCYVTYGLSGNRQ